jgi:chromosome segregation ATPase
MSDDPILAAIAQLRTDVMGSLERLNNAVTGIRDDIAVNYYRAERAQTAADSTHDEQRQMGTEIAAMWRQIKRLESQVREIRGDP